MGSNPTRSGRKRSFGMEEKVVEVVETLELERMVALEREVMKFQFCFR